MIRLRLLGYKGYFVLSNILSYSAFIDDVVIACDKNVQDDYYEEIKHLCIDNNISYYDRTNEPECNSVYSIAIGWRWLSSDKNARIIVFHDSLLPRYRGFNPLVTALINGDSYVGVTCLLGSGEYDRGAIISQRRMKVDYPAKIQNVIENISPLYLDLMIDFLNKIEKKQPIRGEEQDEQLATYSLWRDQSDYYIDWDWDADKIKRHIDAVGYPYAGAKTLLDDQELIIKEASIVDDVKIENRKIGKVIFKRENGLVIVCGKGLLLVKDFYTSNNELFNYENKFRLKFR